MEVSHRTTSHHPYLGERERCLNGIAGHIQTSRRSGRREHERKKERSSIRFCSQPLLKIAQHFSAGNVASKNRSSPVRDDRPVRCPRVSAVPRGTLPFRVATHPALKGWAIVRTRGLSTYSPNEKAAGVFPGRLFHPSSSRFSLHRRNGRDGWRDRGRLRVATGLETDAGQFRRRGRAQRILRQKPDFTVRRSSATLCRPLRNVQRNSTGLPRPSAASSRIAPRPADASCRSAQLHWPLQTLTERPAELHWPSPTLRHARRSSTVHPKPSARVRCNSAHLR